MIQPLSYNEFLEHTRHQQQTVVFLSIPIGILTPIIVYEALNKMPEDEGVIFESLGHNENHYSYLCFDTVASLTIDSGNDSETLMQMREFQKQISYETRVEVAGLISNSMGFVTYDAIRCFEQIPDKHHADASLPLILFNAYSLCLTFDHTNQLILISLLTKTDNQPELAYQEAQYKLQEISESLLQLQARKPIPKKTQLAADIDTDISDIDFMKMVMQTKDYIIRGDAFQIVLSRCFIRHYSIPPLDIYKTLCDANPAPFMFYFPTTSGAMVGASPERFIRIHNQSISINPIAGTRKRTETSDDHAITTDILNDKKEVAEHMMLVDLARNDVGSVSKPGSVEIAELLNVKHYAHVSHITSTVTGILQDKYDVLDAFVAAFPAGTLSGAPKIRAMQIIDELETSRRGLYGGAICRLDSLGNLDSCIAIRMATLQNGIATIRTGAGIVYDSNPENEAQETLIKAKSMLTVLAHAHGEQHVIDYR